MIIANHMSFVWGAIAHSCKVNLPFIYPAIFRSNLKRLLQNLCADGIKGKINHYFAVYFSIWYGNLNNGKTVDTAWFGVISECIYKHGLNKMQDMLQCSA